VTPETKSAPEGRRSTREQPPATKQPASWRSNWLVELVLIVAVALGLALSIQAFLVKPYNIPSESMLPALEKGQRVLVNRLGDNFGDPSIGDVIVFHPPQGAEDGTCGTKVGFDPEQAGRACSTPTKAKASENFIKRVVAGPGDTLTIKDGHVVLNGKLQRESFIAPCGGGGACNLPKPITVSKGHYFMMGDNRGHSDDSRFWGPVPRDWIIGNAFATYWPPKRIGPL
jgi:signal peptidase I